MRFAHEVKPGDWQDTSAASPSLVIGDFGMISGQLPVDHEQGNEIIDSSIEGETAKVIDNLESVLKANGLDLSYLVKVTVYLTDLNQYDAVERIYAQRFRKPYPARTCVEVCNLPYGAKVQMDGWFLDTKKYERPAAAKKTECCEDDRCSII